ncbi:LANO_0E10858g1_1 [Lachancea nothofagi CBS 11611]|uniref:LANO_0E10858g1_1 n=1 Tax=Lachancea nothofagi CBS 11611 TaxID=1266666 RepID=A0A1G4JX04_9SACH|nr:LANO_0E10858g1_1 [Lachancea nothofagi CBS 11611]
MSGRSKQTLYDTHINMYPPSRGGAGAQVTTMDSPSRSVPYPVDDVQQPMSPIPLQSAMTSQSIRSNSTLGEISKAGTPTNTRYDQPFTFNSPSGLQHSTDSFTNFVHNNSSVDTFQSASDSSAQLAAPPPPYNETELRSRNLPDESQNFLQEKAYRKPSDLAELEETREKPAATGEKPILKRDLSQYNERAKRFHEVYEITVNDSPNFTPNKQMKWCETLFEYAFIDEFIGNYNINGDKLKRTLTPDETLKNQKIILEHALKVLTKLITLQYGPALYLMATLYSHQPYIQVKIQSVIARNDVKALDYYSRAAVLDLSDACYRAGVCYEYERGTPADWNKTRCLQKAIYFYEKGALSCQNVACMYKLGMFCLHGVIDPASGQAIVHQDIKAALSWFGRAIRRDEKVGQTRKDNKPAEASDKPLGDLVSPQAMYELAKIYEFEGLAPQLQQGLAAVGIIQDTVRALRYYHRCATRFSYPLAQWRLGQCYEFGHLNLPVIANKSIAWYAKAATAKPRGNPIAMMALSGWYLTGATGVLKSNNKEAYSWARKACQASEGKLARAEYALGFYYEKGIGCKPNADSARDHYTKAAQAGHQKAQERLRGGNEWRVG